MSWSIRRSAVVLGALVVLGSAAFSRQDVKIEILGKRVVQVGPAGGKTGEPGLPPKDPDAFSNAVDLPKDNERRKMIEAAGDYVRIEDWGTATKTLQKLLMFPEDKMVEVVRTDGDKETKVWVSARREAERLIGTLPPKGIEFYKNSFGPDAKEMLEKARASGKKEDLALVMNFYLHTDAGGVATHLLATRLLDRGDYITSGLCYERLLNREGADKLPATVLFEAAYAYHLAGAADKEEAMWRELRDRVDVLKVAGESHSVTELKEQIGKIARAPSYIAVADCPMVGGAPNRNSQSFGGTAFLESHWRYSLLGAGLDSSSHQTEGYLKQADSLLQRRQPAISAFQPITVTVNQNGTAKPLIVYRNYSGVQARELTTGKLVWDAQSKWGLENMALSSGKLSALNSWLMFYLQPSSRPGILYENSTIGTLSTDGTFVYAVEDLAVPPPPHFMGNPGMPNGAGSPQFGSKELNEAVTCSELQAFELATNGKLKWKIGGPGKDTPLGESYFLGPPLPMGGKVYVLTEKQQELRLACIDANTGKVLTTQVLVTTRDKIQTDVGRRTQAAHLAYGEGILVCPTNAGAILGVDLLTNSLVWAYSYREEQANPPPSSGMQPRFNNGMGGPPINNTQWKVTPPIVQDGRVVFTAPDAGSVHCLNLRDGTPIWTAKRQEDDLYLGGVYNGKVVVVGKHFTKGYSLSKGEKLWDLETGVPSGFGVASDNKYYLPVRESAQSKEPEICIIDVEKGRVMAHTKSRAKDGKYEVPGSLLFYEGDVLSQTSREIVAYPQLEVREKEVTALLQTNPNDPVGLTDRGELRLGRGELPGAIADLGKALANKPNPVTRDKARLKLYESLTDYMQLDFNKAEPYLKTYEELCKVEVDPEASAEEKDKAKAEERRRTIAFLYLVANGRQEQGKLAEAFDKYREFSKLAGTEKLISVPGELAVHTAPDVWTSARIKAMVEAADPAQRTPLEEKIGREWDDLKKAAKSLDEVRQFVRLFGSAFPAGKEARLELANRLIESNEPQSLIEAELNLAMLRGPTEEPAVAARAVETLARLNAQKGLLPDAAYYYRVLRDHYAKVIVRDGKTGAEIFADMESNKFLLPYLYDATPAALTGKVSKGEEVRPPPNGFQNMNPAYTFDQLGEELPFFKQYRIALQTNTHNLKITNRYVDEPARMDQHLTTTFFTPMNNGISMVQIWNPQSGGQISPKYHFLNMGHLVVLPLGHMVFGIDPVDKKVLWEKNLYGPVAGGGGLPPIINPNGMPAITVDQRDNSVQILYTDGWVQRIGQTSSLEGQVICLQTRDGLVAIDPLSGRTLWTRSDLSSHSQILSDKDHFYVVELNNENNPSSTRVLRAQDGVALKAPDFALLYQKRLRMSGRNLLLTETDAVKKTVSLRLYDVLAGKDLWKESFPAGSIALHSEEAHLAGMVEPDGRLHVFDMRTQKELFKDSKIDPKHLNKVRSVVLLSDDKDLYVACNGEIDPNLLPWGGIQSNIMPGTGLRVITVNGELYSFNRGNGELNWHNPVPNQMLVMEHFKEMPLLLFTARYNMWTKGAIRNVINVVATESIEKKTGKLKYYNESNNNQMQQFHSLNVDLKGGKIELTSWNLKLVHHLLTADGSKIGDKSGEKSVPTTPAPDPGSKKTLEEQTRQRILLEQELRPPGGGKSRPR